MYGQQIKCMARQSNAWQCTNGYVLTNPCQLDWAFEIYFFFKYHSQLFIYGRAKGEFN